jgi:hypothetical protein
MTARDKNQAAKPILSFVAGTPILLPGGPENPVL